MSEFEKRTRQVTERTTGKLRWSLSFRLPRHTELRWTGSNVQWVLSPVQVALWTDMRGRRVQPYNWRFNWCPLPRSY